MAFLFDELFIFKALKVHEGVWFEVFALAFFILAVYRIAGLVFDMGCLSIW